MWFAERDEQPRSWRVGKREMIRGVAWAILLVNAGIVEFATAQENPPPAEPLPPADKILFEEHVVPILQSHCWKCHGAEMRKAGLDLRRRSTMLVGGDSGAAIVPGQPGASLLVEMLVAKQMPPEDEPPLNDRQIEIIKRWLAAGGRLRSKEEPLETTDDEPTIAAADRQFWAFRTPVRPPIPVVSIDANVATIAGPIRNPVDAFVLDRLRQIGAGFNPEAPRPVLIRRLYYDLWGLPPSPTEIDDFVNDSRADAYERLVDRLLASPRYGERWGRHWLDVAGYADSDGYLEADRLRPEAWRYRDYVIRAFNDDKPYDRFVLEQLAGDELADWRRAEELTPELADNLIATGFLRTAMDPTYGGYAEPLECYKVMADTIQIVSTAFLGVTMQCARCHAHKIDPISQRDYYRLHAVFLASYDPDRWHVSANRWVPLATETEQARIDKHNQAVDARLADLNKTLAELTARFRDRFLNERLVRVDDSALREQIKAALLIDEKKRDEPQKQLLAQHAAGLEVNDEAIARRFPEFGDEQRRMRAAIEAEGALKKSVVQIRGLQDLGESASAAHVLIRGDYQQRGKAVEPGMPAVLLPNGDEPVIERGYKTSGRRLALARWLIDPQHPLTARVQVNRIWAQHFGRGLVATLDNFGQAGARPSHPELLDWLATEFIRRGWSQKEMHRLLLTSTTWRQDSRPNTAQASSDPDNVLLGAFRPQRLQGEAIRDALLAVGGQLDRRMYGSPIDVAAHGDGRVTVAAGPQANRASVYLIVRRSQPVTLLELFDTPRMEINCPQRNESVVVTQSLALLHSGFVEANARQLADRLTATTDDESQRIEAAYQRLFARAPSDSERAEVVAFLDAVQAAGGVAISRHEAWVQLCVVLLNSNEFLYVH